MTVPSYAGKVYVNAEAESKKAKVEGTGLVEVKDQTTKVTITVTAMDGSKMVYTVTIEKEPEEPMHSYFLQVDYYRGLVVTDIYPGFQGTHSFTVKNVSKRTLVYTISFRDVTNTFVGSDLKYNVVKDGKNLLKDWTTVPREDGVITEDIIIGPGETANYDINYWFVNTNVNQDVDMGKTFNAGVIVTFDDASILKR